MKPKQIKIMLNITLSYLAVLTIVSCKKETVSEKESFVPTASVKVMIDYVGPGGYYNDDIDIVPTGLSIGSVNGPYKVPLTNTYTIQYQADSKFQPIKVQTNFGGGMVTAYNNYIIHCYVEGNTEYIKIEHE